MAAEDRAVEHEGNRKRDYHHQDDRVRNAGENDIRKAVVTDIDDAEESAVTEFAEGFAKARNSARTGDLQRHAARDQHHAESGDKGR
ncbi:hypothetical protein D3C80_1731760 [compost metagenome]